MRQALFQVAIPASLRRGDIEVLLAAQQLNVAVVEQLHAGRIAFYTALYESLARRTRPVATLAPRCQPNERRRRAMRRATSDRGALASATLARAGTRSANRGRAPRLRRGDSATGDRDRRRSRAGRGVAFSRGRRWISVRSNFPLASETSAALERRADLRLARLLVRAGARRSADQRGRLLSATRSRRFSAATFP